MRLFVLLFFLSSLLFVSCAQPTDSTDNGTVERERVEVSGLISEDTVWESGKEYYVTGDVMVKAGATLTIEPNVVVKFAHERADDYYGITVKGTLIADGGDSTTAILFTSGAPEWAKKPGDWRGIEVEASSDSSSVIRYCHIQVANVGIKADRSSPRVRYSVVEQCADTGILFHRGAWGSVLDCIVAHNGNGIRFEYVGTGDVMRCSIYDNHEKGIECKTSSPHIQNNRITGNKEGIYCSYEASPLIRQNDILYQEKIGVTQFGNCRSDIFYNRIIQNSGDGIEIGTGKADIQSSPRIMWNTIIVSPPGYGIRLNMMKYRPAHDILAIENYWGTEDASLIEDAIYDVTDRTTPLPSGVDSHGDYRYYQGKVIFEPFLTEPVGGLEWGDTAIPDSTQKASHVQLYFRQSPGVKIGTANPMIQSHYAVCEGSCVWVAILEEEMES